MLFLVYVADRDDGKDTLFGTNDSGTAIQFVNWFNGRVGEIYSVFSVGSHLTGTNLTDYLYSSGFNGMVQSLTDDCTPYFVVDYDTVKYWCTQRLVSAKYLKIPHITKFK